MYSFDVRIRQIQSKEGLNLVSFSFFDTELVMMSLALAPEVTVGTRVRLGFKPTATTLAKNFTGDISISNVFEAKVCALEEGELLCHVSLEASKVRFESIITKACAQRLALQEGETVKVLIKASELSILEVYDV